MHSCLNASLANSSCVRRSRATEPLRRAYAGRVCSLVIRGGVVARLRVPVRFLTHVPGGGGALRDSQPHELLAVAAVMLGQQGYPKDIGC
eukprot:217111-Pleurochrysis_carterae.AAC.3